MALTLVDDPLYAISLRLHDLRVPTLVGVNENERLARQFVVATVTLDKFNPVAEDHYTALEALVVKVNVYTRDI